MIKPLNKDTILVDTSVWIDFLRGIETPYSLHLKKILPISAVAICPTILQEILQGVLDNNKRSMVDTYFKHLARIDNDPYQMAEEAAKLYRSLRKIGITIRKPNDCLIAAYAIHNDIALLQDDRDFDYIADNSDLMLVKL